MAKKTQQATTPPPTQQPTDQDPLWAPGARLELRDRLRAANRVAVESLKRMGQAPNPMLVTEAKLNALIAVVLQAPSLRLDYEIKCEEQMALLLGQCLDSQQRSALLAPPDAVPGGSGLILPR